MQTILLEDVRFSRPINATAAGTTDINGTGVDMQADGGYDGILFVLAVGALTASQVTKLLAQSSTDDGSADAYVAILNSTTASFADADGNKLAVLDVFRPPERWVRPVVDRATANAAVDGVIAIQYRGKKRPTVQHGDVKVKLTCVNQVN